MRRADPSSRGVLNGVCVCVIRYNKKSLHLQWVEKTGENKKLRREEKSGINYRRSERR